MLVPLSWLKDYVDIDVTPKEARLAKDHHTNTKNSKFSRISIYVTYHQVQSRSYKLQYRLWHLPLRLW